MVSTDRSKAKGILCIVASAFGFALMAFFVRLCDDFGGPISCFQKGFFRNFVALVIALCVFVRTKRETGVPMPPRSAYPTLFARCLFGSVGIFANFYAISHIQVGEAMALNKTAPFFTVLFSWLVLGERATRRQVLCLALAFAGAMLVVKPGFRTGNMAAYLPSVAGFAQQCGYSGAVLGLASGLGAGIAYTCVHKLGRMKVAGSFIVLAFSAFSCLASVPFTVLDYRPMTAAQVLILFGAGAGAAMGQFGITAAYRFAEPRAIAAYDYTGVAFSALFGLVFFAQVPDVSSVVGFMLILLCAIRLRK